MKRCKKCDQMTRHHVVPLSRHKHPKRKSVVYVHWSMHTAWHYLFGTMTVPEVIKYIITHWTGDVYDANKDIINVFRKEDEKDE